MNRIDEKFIELKKNKNKALIVYICAGDPDIKITEQLAAFLGKAGVDILELGVPFSDPLADGPTIQAASQRALRNKINLTMIFALVKRIRKKSQMPIVLMGYYNPVFAYGLKPFVDDAKTAGVDGVIIPDLPVHEAGEINMLTHKKDLSIIYLATPTTSLKRMKKICQESTGFIYYVSLTGVTGARDRLPSRIISDVKSIKGMTKKPVCVGFGVSKPSQVKRIIKFADGVIVGSAVIKKIEKSLGSKSRILSSVSSFVNKLSKPTKH